METTTTATMTGTNNHNPQPVTGGIETGTQDHTSPMLYDDQVEKSTKALQITILLYEKTICVSTIPSKRIFPTMFLSVSHKNRNIQAREEMKIQSCLSPDVLSHGHAGNDLLHGLLLLLLLVAIQLRLQLKYLT